MQSEMVFVLIQMEDVHGFLVARVPLNSAPTARLSPGASTQRRWRHAAKGRPALLRRIGQVYYMINCAHPLHFEDTLVAGEAWTAHPRYPRQRLAAQPSGAEGGARPRCGRSIELGGQYRDLLRRHAQINVLGCCCGTDHRHVESISRACRTAA